MATTLTAVHSAEGIPIQLASNVTSPHAPSSGIYYFSGNKALDVSLGPGALFFLAHSGYSFGNAFFNIRQFNKSSLPFQSFAGQTAGPYDYHYVTKLGANVLISAQQFTKASSSGPNQGRLALGVGGLFSQWLSPGTGYIGFKFNIGQPGGPQYGWARITMNTGPTQNNFTFDAWAFGRPGQTGLLTGEVPVGVPDSGSSLGLLALGSAGLLAWRRKHLREAVEG